MFKKITLSMVVACSVISSPLFAATEIPKEDMGKYVHVGDISLSGDFASPNDALAAIKVKAEKNDADFFYVSRFTKGNRGYAANAVLYKGE